MRLRLVMAMVMAILLPLCASAQTMDDLKKLSSSDAAKSATESMGGSMSGVLQSQLGLDQNQADGGIGSMLTLASEKLDTGEFSKLTGMIPGADQYMQSAKSLGAVTGPLKDMAGLNTAFSALGISPEVASRFVPTVTDYLGKLGGADTQGLLQKAFGA